MQYTGNIGWWYHNGIGFPAIRLAAEIILAQPMFVPFGFYLIRYIILTQFHCGCPVLGIAKVRKSPFGFERKLKKDRLRVYQVRNNCPSISKMERGIMVDEGDS